MDVDPKFDKTNNQTEIMIEIEQKPFRIIADSGATSSGINLSVVKELNLLPSMKPTEYTYRTSSGKVEKALGTVEVSLRIGPIVVKTDMVVMQRITVRPSVHPSIRLGVVITCYWAMN
jgi:predicted aspartyl protease